jgi:hypothetical protein
MYKVNISIDDISPHPLSSINVLKRCYEIIKVFPDIKFSLFVPIAYWRTTKPITVTKEPLVIAQYPDFCEYIKNLPEENFEIGYHGLFHGVPGKTDNDEFHHINYEQAKEKFELMFTIAEAAGLRNKFKSIFRPPAWKMCEPAFRASKDVGIELLALTDLENGTKTYEGNDKIYEKVTYANVFPPFRELQMHEKTGIVYHACEWDRNYLSEDYTKQLIEFLTKFEDEIEFCFLDEM